MLDKSAYVNSNGKVFLSVWFMGCDDNYAELSWHTEGQTSIWGLNHRCPWNIAMSHQEVTTTGFDHYHDLNANNVCGWCQETIELGINVDGKKDDWNEEVLSTNNEKTTSSYSLLWRFGRWYATHRYHVCLAERNLG